VFGTARSVQGTAYYNTALNLSRLPVGMWANFTTADYQVLYRVTQGRALAIANARCPWVHPNMFPCLIAERFAAAVASAPVSYAGSLTPYQKAEIEAVYAQVLSHNGGVTDAHQTRQKLTIIQIITYMTTTPVAEAPWLLTFMDISGAFSTGAMIGGAADVLLREYAPSEVNDAIDQNIYNWINGMINAELNMSGTPYFFGQQEADFMGMLNVPVTFVDVDYDGAIGAYDMLEAVGYIEGWTDSCTSDDPINC
jgi:hypothetical protein